MPRNKHRNVGKKFKRQGSDEPDGDTAEFGNPTEFGNLDTEMATAQQVADIFKRLDKLDILDTINKRLIDFEKELTSVKVKVGDLEKANNFSSAQIETLEQKKADKTALEKLEAQVEDLANRSRRNNLVFLNVPENKEAEHNGKCSELIKAIVTENLKINADGFILDRVHRTPTQMPNVPREKPRPIHVAFHYYSDRQSVLRAAKNLKTNPYPAADAKFKLVIIEDVTPKLQAERAKLWKHRKTLLRENPGRKVYINYPASMKIMEPGGAVWPGEKDL